ncbi:DUF4811 domain-containing protein [uncultured Limosilactobacillus sp.]|uniref:DUF4811 domain-containing protein n=1 Tax=uncultured Limosilactobacillus sp. TaxID=2837629 RepID=UPI0025D565B6|nr:DUF4811 domain-containing protein [uncultured Limosilactobacillus sp.]
MVIILLIFGCLALFSSAMFLPTAGKRVPAVIISGIIMVGATTMMVLNYHSHLGMKQVTTTTTQTVEPVSAKLPIALYQPLGTAGNEEVLMYRLSANGKVKHTPADENISCQMKFANVSSLTMTTTKTTWQFKNGFYRSLFLWSGMNGTLVKKQTTITYPQEFVKVTPQQMKKLKAALQPANPASQAAQKQALDLAVKAKLAQSPQATAQQKQAIAQQVQRQAAAKMIKQALAK